MSRLLLSLVLLIGSGLAGPVAAHVGGSAALASITISGNTVRYDVQIPTGTLPSAMLDATHLTDPLLAPDYRPLMAAVAAHVRLRTKDGACEAVPSAVTPPAQPGGEAGVLIHYACPAAPQGLTIEDDLADVLGPHHQTIANIRYGVGSQQYVFRSDARTLDIDVADAAAAEPTSGFFRLGIEHILTGYDHLLFLLALILAGGSLWSLLKVVTAFTVAHSVTLALAVLGIVVLPGRLVECAIAASIAYVAAENLFARKAASHRWIVSFVFGLVHGFGFSTVLRDLGLPKAGLAWSLLSFNLGVEAGQAAVVIAALPLLVGMRRLRWEPKIAAALSALILAVGITLLVERGWYA